MNSEGRTPYAAAPPHTPSHRHLAWRAAWSPTPNLTGRRRLPLGAGLAEEQDDQGPELTDTLRDLIEQLQQLVYRHLFHFGVLGLLLLHLVLL